VFPDSDILPDLQPVFPITAAGPPRIFTVFRDTEAMIMTIRYFLQDRFHIWKIGLCQARKEEGKKSATLDN
jgi:hypothetical protein